MVGVRITEEPARTGAILPTDNELKRLLEIVAARHPGLVKLRRDGEDDDGFDLADFKLAFLATTRFFRIRETRRDLFFYGWVQRASELLDREVRGDALLCATLAAGDIPVRLASPRHGQLLELGLHEFRGASATNAWRAVLATGVLPPTLPPRQAPGYVGAGAGFMPTFG